MFNDTHQIKRTTLAVIVLLATQPYSGGGVSVFDYFRQFFFFNYVKSIPDTLSKMFSKKKKKKNRVELY